MKEDVARCFKFGFEMRKIRTKFPFLEVTDELFSDDSFSKKFSQGSDKLRKENVLTDVVLEVDGKMFPAHRIILATSGDYFMSMFSGPLAANEKHVCIHGVSATTMESILTYMYCGTIIISEENVQDLLEASALMLLENLKNRCAKFLRDRIDDENCLRIFSISKQFSLQALEKKTLELITTNFSELSSQPDFQLLQVDVLIDILSCEEISVPNENSIFNAVLTWFNYEPHQRVGDLEKVFKVIHLPFVSVELLNNCIENVEIRSNFNVLALLNSAVEMISNRRYLDDRFLENGSDTFPKTWLYPRKCEQYVTSIVALGGPTLSIFNFDTNCWGELARCTPRHCPGMAVLDSNIYVVGGSSEWKRKSCGEYFSTESYSWFAISDMNTPRSNFGLVQLRGKLYALGGYDGNFPLRKVEVYDPKTNTWTNIPDMHSPRDGACDISDGECLYTIGGYDGSHYLTSTDFYDPETNIWNNQKVPQLQVKRQNAMCAYYDARIYVIGGYYKDQHHSSVEVLDLEQMKWLTVAPLPKPRHYGGASAVNGHVFVCGGWSVQLPVSTVDVYSIDEDTWSSISDLPTPTMVRCCTINIHRKVMLKISSQQAHVNKCATE